jgi:hypothetical protein
MSVVIIIGGGNARNAIGELEAASLNMDDLERAESEALLAEITLRIKRLRADHLRRIAKGKEG